VVEQIFSSAHLEYRIAGGLATYLYVEERDPDAGRLTKDIDIAVRRDDLLKIAAAAKNFGFEHRHVSGVDILAPSNEPSARRAVHLVFAGQGNARTLNAMRPDKQGTQSPIEGYSEDVDKVESSQPSALLFLNERTCEWDHEPLNLRV